jgi:thiol-disulfide isomerase/thioredoxin
MNYRIYGLTAAATACVAALVFLLVRPDPPSQPRLIPVEDPPAYTPAPGEFAGQMGPVKVTDPATPVPELRFADAEGREISLVDFRGRALVVNLWATWCVPCVEELPALDRLQAKLGGPTFEVVALSVDRERPAVAPFLEKHGIKNLARYLDTGNIATRTLKARALPTTLLIDAEGREVGRLEGAAPWDSPAAEAYLKRVLLPAG